jgi:hypothetical protein
MADFTPWWTSELDKGAALPAFPGELHLIAFPVQQRQGEQQPRPEGTSVNVYLSDAHALSFPAKNRSVLLCIVRLALVPR